MKTPFTLTMLAGSVLFAALVSANENTDDYISTLTELGFPAPKDNELVHIPPYAVQRASLAGGGHPAWLSRQERSRQ